MSNTTKNDSDLIPNDISDYIDSFIREESFTKKIITNYLMDMQEEINKYIELSLQKTLEEDLPELLQEVLEECFQEKDISPNLQEQIKIEIPKKIKKDPPKPTNIQESLEECLLKYIQTNIPNDAMPTLYMKQTIPKYTRDFIQGYITGCFLSYMKYKIKNFCREKESEANESIKKENNNIKK